MTEVRAAALAELPAGQPTLVVLDGTRVVLARVGDRVYAVGDACAHAVYGSNLSRLRDVKRQYDPDNVFHINLNIAP